MTVVSPVLIFHICAATVGLISGALAVCSRKGSGPHRIAGNVFFPAMLCMSASGAWVAYTKQVMVSVVVGLLIFYVVATAWAAAKRRDGKVGLFDWIALLFVLAVVAGAFEWGIEASKSSINGMKNGIPVAMYFAFGTIALLFALFDVRMIVRGGLTNAQRIGRHLWRMCFALLIALMSFFPGQQWLFPAAVRRAGIAYLPHLLLLGFAIFWLIRRPKRPLPAVVTQS